MANGYIKLHRSLIKWEWYTDANTLRLFLHCLLMANHSDVKFRGVLIKRGSFQTSFQMLSAETGLSIQNIRTSLNKLEVTGELTHQSTTKNSMITVNNYDEYQSDNKQTNKQLTSDQQTTNIPLTTNKNEKNLKNDKKNIIKPLGVVLDEMIDEHTENPDLRKALREFVQYRNSNPKTKISDLGLTKSINQLTKMFGDNTADKIQSIDNSIANGWKGLFDIDKKGDKLTYGWQEELKAEQDKFDNQGYEPKRSAEEAKRKLDEL
jgi:hypothetical protein